MLSTPFFLPFLTKNDYLAPNGFAALFAMPVRLARPFRKPDAFRLRQISTPP